MNEHRTPRAVDHREDFYAWTQHQATLLGTLARYTSNLPEGLDLENLADEVIGLGAAELNSVKSYIRQIMTHLIKAISEPKSRAVGHWRSEASSFNSELLDRYTASMHQLIDLQPLWRRALRDAKLQLQEHNATVSAAVPAECPYSLAEFTSEDFSFDDLRARLLRAD